jgi:hypothetical protein
MRIQVGGRVFRGLIRHVGAERWHLTAAAAFHTLMSALS